MIADLKPYPAMKDSGVEWLGEVPEHWDLPRTKTVLRERSEKGHPDEVLLAATQTKGVVRKDQYENRTVLAMKDLHLLKLVEVDDFVISLRSFQGGIESARVRGIISPAYTVLYPADSPFQDYLAKLFKSSPYIENLGLYVTGIRQGQNIDYEKLSRSRLPLPPLPEQAAIVRYLDHVDRRVRRLTRAKRKLIALLTEQKQAIIHRAVTRGLDPDVPLKDSGVEWLGEVPEHWEVRRLKTLLAAPVTDGPHSTPDFLSEGVPFLSVDGIQKGELVFEDCRYVSPEDHAEFRKKTAPQYGDILLGKAASTGKIARVKVDFEFSIWSPLALIRPRESAIRSSYLELALKDVSSQAQVEILCTLNTQKNISMGDIPRIIVPLPPLPEQAAIVEYLDQATADIDTTISRAEREIELLGQYRTRLIADVVTGKLDVRDAAAALPEVDPLAEDDGEEDLDANLDLDIEEPDEALEEVEA